MTVAEILMMQITDPLRLGLIVALVVLALRTERPVGRYVPLGLGVLAIAAFLPLITGRGLVEGAVGQAILLGIVANFVLLALVMAIRHVVLRIMP